MSQHDLEFLNVPGYEIGHVVRRNGIILIKPDGMSDNYWYRYEAPKCGKFLGEYDGKKPLLYGHNAELKPTWDPNEIQEDGCAGGGCVL